MTISEWPSVSGNFRTRISFYLTRSRQLRCCARQVPQQPPPQVPRRYRPRYALPLQHLNGFFVLFSVGDSLLRTDGRSGKEKSTERADVDLR